MKRPLAVALAFLCLAATSAHATKYKPHIAIAESSGCVSDNNGRTTCPGPVSRSGGSPRVAYEDGTVIGGRPAGCPYRFCGCEASLYLFGRIIPELNLAANWKRKFPRAEPAPGMAAARSGHVFVLLSHVEGSEWLVHDGNSGGGKTRVHVRSLRGYVIVNPHGSRVAMR